MKKILVATNNQGKLKEIREILKEVEIISLKEVSCEVEVEEDEDSFEGNALKKAREISKKIGIPCIADDSGLCIKYLDGFPGVKTARFLGEKATQEERNRYLLKQLENIPKEKRQARVVTVIAYVDDKIEKTYIGEIHGYIAESERGDNGFGFDPIFELESGKTLAQLTQKEKNKVSSRKLALELLNKDLEKNI